MDLAVVLLLLSGRPLATTPPPACTAPEIATDIIPHPVPVIRFRGVGDLPEFKRFMPAHFEEAR